ncbi:alpha/beta hydrolase [Caenimonas terrae]|uniref:Alpha/beta hydrolase n=1 Tax=Caenimonas terrae TaxID=696074 RepID=A0ABW0NJC9_9BURK
MTPSELPLSFLHRPAAAGTEPSWLLVLMHGVGSNEQDLFALAPQVPPQYHVLSLRGPFALGPGAYAWFTFGVGAGGGRVIDAAQEAASRPLVAQAVLAAAARLGVPAERVVVGGFSQGGIMSLSLLLTRPELLHAAMVMHSRLLPEVLPLVAPAQQLHGRELWVSHGTQDGVIPLASAHHVRDAVAAWPIALTYKEYPGGHELRPAELRDAMGWLQGLTEEG